MGISSVFTRNVSFRYSRVGLKIKWFSRRGSPSASGSGGFRAQRSHQRSSLAGSDQHRTGASEAQSAYILLYYTQNRPKGDLSQTCSTLQVGVSPAFLESVLASGRPEPPRGPPPPKPVLAGVGRRQSTEFRWSSRFRGPLPGALERDIWLQRAGRSLWTAYSAPAEE